VSKPESRPPRVLAVALVQDAILNLAAELNQNRLGSNDDWRIGNTEYLYFGEPGLYGYGTTYPASVGIDKARASIAGTVTDWIKLGGGRSKAGMGS
jgi:hypothetical protein